MVNATPRPLYPRERDPVPIVEEAGRSQGQSGLVRKISHSPGFDIWTFHSSHPAHLGIQRINCLRTSYELECSRAAVPNLFSLAYPLAALFQKFYLSYLQNVLINIVALISYLYVVTLFRVPLSIMVRTPWVTLTPVWESLYKKYIFPG
jgi:hypothetical protein